MLSLSELLLKKIAIQEDAIEVMRTFYELYADETEYSDCDLEYLQHQLLAAATEHNHTELRILHLANVRCMVYDVLICGSLSDEKSCLEASSWITSNYASSDHGEIVELLMADDMVLNLHGVRRLLQSGPETFKHDKGTRNPLNNILTLAKDCFFNYRQLALPDIVRLLINAGADIHDCNSDGFTPLNYLMSQIEEFQTDDHDYAMASNTVIVDVTRILLEAGSKIDGFAAERGLDGPGLPEPLHHVAKAMDVDTVFGEDSREDRCGFHYALVSDLIELLLSHGARPKRWYDLEAYYRQFYASSGIVSIYRRKAAVPGFLDSYEFALSSLNMVLDGIANTIRCFWLAETVKETSIVNFGEMTEEDFVDTFVEVAAYSSPCVEAKTSSGRTTKFTHSILNTMSTTQMNILRRILSRRIHSKESEMSDELRADTINALEWVRATETPFSLLHLTRHAIVRSMGNKSLQNISKLGLPEQLQRYVLLIID